MPLRGNKKAKDEQKERDASENTEGGFGTGLRAQLQKRRDENTEEAAPVQVPEEQHEPAIAPVALDAPAPEEVSDDAEPSVELEAIQAQLADARKRERELRAAFAEQVEAYERKLSEEYDVSREQTKLEDRSAKISTTERDLREREQRLAEERRALNAERKQLSELKDELVGAQSRAATLQEDLRARESELTEA